MTEYRSVLERAGSNAPQPDLQVERVLRRRDRRQRNQRISAGALGVIVTLALGTVLVRSVTSEPIPADPPVVPRPAPAASGTLAYDARRRHLRRRSGRLERGPGRERPSRRGLLRRRRVLGGGTDVVARRAVPRLSSQHGLFQLGAVVGRRNQRRGGQRDHDVPRAGVGYRVVARFHTRRGVGPPATTRPRRSASTGSTGLGRRSSRCRPDGPVTITSMTTRRGCRTVAR